MDIELFVIDTALGFIPGAGPFIPLFNEAYPILKIGIPIAKSLIEQGIPKVEAFAQAHPDLLDTIKNLIAFGQHGNTDRANDLTDEQAAEMAGPVLLGQPWTSDDLQRFWDRQDQVS